MLEMLMNSKAAAGLAQGLGSALGGGPQTSQSGAVDGRGWLDGSGWTVATGTGKATGGDRQQSGDPWGAPVLPDAAGTQQAGMGWVGMALLAVVAVAFFKRGHL